MMRGWYSQVTCYVVWIIVMSDIWTAVIVMTFVSAAAATLSGRFLYTEKGQLVMLLLSLSVFATVLFQIYLTGQLFLGTYRSRLGSHHLHESCGRLCRDGSGLGVAITRDTDMASGFHRGRSR